MKKWIAVLAGSREKMDSLDLRNISSILIKPTGDAIGDAIAHTAHLNQLRKFNPNIQLGVIVTNRNKEIFINSGLADVLIEDSLMQYLSQRKKWDLYIDFQPTFTTKSILCEKILSPKYIVVFNKSNKKHYNINSVKNFNLHIKTDKGIHISEYLSMSPLGELLERSNAIYTLKYNVDLNNKRWESSKLKILISPQGSNRCIPEQEIIDLLNNIDEKILLNSKFLLSVMKNRDGYYEQVRKGCSEYVKLELLSEMDIINYLHVVGSSDLIISVDSGTVHLACALDKNLLAFYANNSANINKWYPKSHSKNFHVILSEIEADSNHTYDFDMRKAANWINKNFLVERR